MIERIENWEKGSNTDKNGTGGNSPIIAMTAPADITMSSGQATAISISTGTNLDIISQQSTQITAGKNLVARVKERISLFTYKMGIKIVAAAGRVEIQAHSDNIEMTAGKNFIDIGGWYMGFQRPNVISATDKDSNSQSGSQIEKDNVKKVTRAINGGETNWEGRLKYTRHAKEVLQ